MSGSVQAPGFGAQQTSPNNPYGLTPSAQQLMQAIQALGAGVANAGAAPSANYMRANMPPVWNQAQQPTLLGQILAMRNQVPFAAPYQAGVPTPRVSLLSG